MSVSTQPSNPASEQKLNSTFWRSVRSAFDNVWVVVGLVATSLSTLNLIQGLFKFGLSDIFAKFQELYTNGIREPLLNLIAWFRLPSLSVEAVDGIVLWLLIGGIVGRAQLVIEQQKRMAAARLVALSAEEGHFADRLRKNIMLVLRSAKIGTNPNPRQIGLLRSALLVIATTAFWPMAMVRQIVDPLVYQTRLGFFGGKDWETLIEFDGEGSAPLNRIAGLDLITFGIDKNAKPSFDMRVVLLAQTLGVFVCLLVWTVLNALPGAYST